METELKTLKDFRRPKDEEAPYTGEWAMGINETCDNLRKEAIKDIKELRDHRFYCVVCEKFDCDCGSSDFFKLTSEKVEAYIKWKFNITEKEVQ